MSTGSIVVAKERFLGSPFYPELDYRDPDYDPIYKDRALRVQQMRHDPNILWELQEEYEQHPLPFIRHWAMTWEPRVALPGYIDPTIIPMVPFARQEDFINWLFDSIQNKKRGGVDKSRDCGATWIGVYVALWMLLFVPGSSVGFGSRKKEYVDQTKNLKAFFQRLLFAIQYVPAEFLPPGWGGKHPPQDYADSRIANPIIGSFVVGEAGKDIGRGDRTTVTLVDESAFHQNLAAVHAALSANTDCMIDISSAGAPGNEFTEIKEAYLQLGRLFVFDYADDPRKGPEWEEEKRKQLSKSIFGLEYERNEYQTDPQCLLPYEWLKSCVDSHLELGMRLEGMKVTSYDPADTGDSKAYCHRHGSIIVEVDEMVDGDLDIANIWVFGHAQEYGCDVFIYDHDGLGLTVGREAKQHFANRASTNIQAFQNAGSVLSPNKVAEVPPAGHDWGEIFDKRTNMERFPNRRAQAYKAFSNRVRNTHFAIQARKRGEVIAFDHGDLISISSKCTKHRELLMELAKIHKKHTGEGKEGIESKHDMRRRKVKSPNLADAVMMNTHAKPPPARIQRIRFKTVQRTMEY